MNYKVELQGLHCDACKKIAEKRIGKLEGVSSVIVDLKQQTALIQTDQSLSKTEVEGVLKDTTYKITAFVEV